MEGGLGRGRMSSLMWIMMTRGARVSAGEGQEDRETPYCGRQREGEYKPRLAESLEKLGRPLSNERGHVVPRTCKVARGDPRVDR